MRIGIFDSGVGGLSVANAIRKALPNDDVILREDKGHVPYGTRPPEEILGFVTPIFDSLIGQGCQVIVVACNTVSTTLMNELRERYSIPLIATEPMVKPASQLTRTNVIAVCATPTTLASKRFNWLKETYAKGVKVLEPDCSDWAFMIEHRQVDRQKIRNRIEQVLDGGADVIVLGCTHYHWIEEEIKEISANRATVIQPERVLISQLKRVLAQPA